jgi:hypothetical protein
LALGVAVDKHLTTVFAPDGLAVDEPEEITRDLDVASRAKLIAIIEDADAVFFAVAPNSRGQTETE